MKQEIDLKQLIEFLMKHKYYDKEGDIWLNFKLNDLTNEFMWVIEDGKLDKS